MLEGEALIRFRDPGRRGDRVPCVGHGLPGRGHPARDTRTASRTSGTGRWSTLFWAGEIFDPDVRTPFLDRCCVARLKVMTVVGTRPEIIRLSRVMAALDRHVDHVARPHRAELRLRAEPDLLRRPRAPAARPLPRRGGADAPPRPSARSSSPVDAVLGEVRPDAVLVLGDTNSCLAAIPAKRRQIPVFHMEAGNRCFDKRVPEEINRRIVDHIADINLPYSDISREYLLREGLPPDRIIKTGSPMYEVLHHYLPKIERSDVLARLGLEPERLLPGELPPGGERRFPGALPRLVEVLRNLAAQPARG